MSKFLSTDVSTSKIANSAQDFVLLCDDTDSLNAVHALYYLPNNFKLTIMKDTTTSQSMASTWTENVSVKDRVHYEKKENLAKESPFSFAGAAISNLAVIFGELPCVPAGSPEAIASAALKLSRTAA